MASTWDELTLLTEKFHRLRLNYEQCATASSYRDELEHDMPWRSAATKAREE